MKTSIHVETFEKLATILFEDKVRIIEKLKNA